MVTHSGFKNWLVGSGYTTRWIRIWAQLDWKESFRVASLPEKIYIYNHFSHKSKGSSPDLCRSIAKSEKNSALTRPSLHGQLGNSLLPKELLLPSVVLVCGFCNIGCFVGSVFHDPIHSDYTGRCSSPYWFFCMVVSLGLAFVNGWCRSFTPLTDPTATPPVIR